MWFNILKPIAILFVISSSISLLFSNDVYKFFKVFFIASIGQIIVYEIYKKILQIFAEKIRNERIKELSKQGMDIKCPCYLEKEMFVPIELNKINEFKCLECNKNFSVELTAKTFTKTEIIDLDNAEAALIEVYKKIQNKE